MGRNYVDYSKLIGQTNGKIKCVGWEWRPFKINEKKPYLKCVCECGVEKYICAHYWPKTKSCGCVRKGFKGINSPTFKHGANKTRLHLTWTSMRERLTNPNNSHFKHYGGKGIKRCKEWDDFNEFKKWAISTGYNDKLTIERKDINGDYCPENCEWIPFNKQGRNTSRSVRVMYNGELKSLPEWCEILGLNYKKQLGKVYRHRKKTGELKLFL